MRSGMIKSWRFFFRLFGRRHIPSARPVFGSKHRAWYFNFLALLLKVAVASAIITRRACSSIG